jgi:hypothetical protein
MDSLIQMMGGGRSGRIAGCESGGVRNGRRDGDDTTVQERTSF